MKADITLAAATQAIKKRGKDYGTIYENHERIAVIWTVIFGHEVTAAQVALCMASVKMARLVQSPDHEDSWVDLAGYAAVGSECSDDR